MIRAIYTAREDGDYDFLAAFPLETDYDIHPAEAYADELTAQGEEFVLKDFDDLTHLVDVLELNEIN